MTAAVRVCAEIVAAGLDETWAWGDNECTYAELGEECPAFRHRWEELTDTRFHGERAAAIRRRPQRSVR